jgi:hypothetical protein
VRRRALSGKKLFPEGFPTTTFELGESHPLASGVVLSNYRRIEG